MRSTEMESERVFSTASIHVEVTFLRERNVDLESSSDNSLEQRTWGVDPSEINMVSPITGSSSGKLPKYELSAITWAFPSMNLWPDQSAIRTVVYASELSAGVAKYRRSPSSGNSSISTRVGLPSEAITEVVSSSKR